MADSELSIDGYGFTFRDLNETAQRMMAVLIAKRTNQGFAQMADDIKSEGEQTREKIAELRTVTGEAFQRQLDRNAALQEQLAARDAQIAELGGQVKAGTETAELLDQQQTEMDADIAKLRDQGVDVEPPVPQSRRGGKKK